MDIIHFQNIAKPSRDTDRITFNASLYRQLRHLAPPRARYTSQPVQQMQSRTLPCRLIDRPHQMGSKFLRQALLRHAVTRLKASLWVDKK